MVKHIEMPFASYNRAMSDVALSVFTYTYADISFSEFIVNDSFV